MAEDNENENRQQEKSPQCYTRRHLPMAASAYHDYALTVSWQSKIFFSDDRRDAKDFGVSNKTIFALRTWLEDHGWLVPLDKKSERERSPVTGRWLPIRYRVLSHDEWAVLHPGKCRFVKPPDVKTTSGPDVDSTAGPDVQSTSGEQSPDVDSSFTGRRFFQSPDVDSTAKLCSYSRYGKPEKRAPVFDVDFEVDSTASPKPKNTAAHKSKLPEIPADTKNADKLKQIVWHLQAGHGCTATELAKDVLGSSSPLARDRVVALVRRLRSLGFHITTQGTDSKCKRYVLKK